MGETPLRQCIGLPPGIGQVWETIEQAQRTAEGILRPSIPFKISEHTLSPTCSPPPPSQSSRACLSHQAQKLSTLLTFAF